MKQARAFKTREQILLAAAQVMDAEGYENASISQIAKAAEVTKGALYFHFDSKEAIALAVIEEQHKISRQIGEQIGAMRLSSVETVLHITAAVGRDYLNNKIVRAGLRLVTEVLIFSKPHRPSWEDWIETGQALLLRGMEEGDVRPDADAYLYAYIMVASFGGLRIASDVLGDGQDLLERLFEFTAITIRSFAVEDRKEALIERAREIFDGYAREVVEPRQTPVA
jgi:AcrR family transcriptional regulator